MLTNTNKNRNGNKSRKPVARAAWRSLETLEDRRMFAAAPIGSFDRINSDGVLIGWAADRDTPNDSIAVHVYVDGQLIAGVGAYDARPDVNQVIQIGGNHGFHYQLPQQFMDGRAHTVHAFGIDSSGGVNSMLPGSGATFTNVPPIGSHDVNLPNGTIVGWAADKSTPEESIAVHVYVDGELVAGVLANDARADVNQAIGIGGNHGFHYQLPDRFMDGRAHTVTVYGIDSQHGINAALGGTTRAFTNAAPVGAFESVSTNGTLYGWAGDKSTPGTSIPVHVYVDGELIAGVATNDSRGDVNAAQGLTGNHGFHYQLPAKFLDGRSHVIHVYAIDSQGGINSLLAGAPKTFRAPNAPPVGSLDSISMDGVVSGWTADRDAPGTSIAAHVYVDGELIAGVPTNDPRSDVNAALGLTGNHGFHFQLPQRFMDGKTHVVNVYGIDAQGGVNALISGSAKSFTNLAPLGSHDGISSDGMVTGWAADLNTPGKSIDVHVYVDGQLIAGVNANDYRADVNSALKVSGNHGFHYQLPSRFLDGQSHTVTVYAIDSQGGINAALSNTNKVFRALTATTLTLSTVSTSPNVSTRLIARLVRSDDISVSIAGAPVTFSLAGKVVGTGMTDSRGVAWFAYNPKMTLRAGTYQYSAEFKQNAFYKGSTGIGTLNVVKAAPRLAITSVSGKVGQTIKLSATLSQLVDGVATAIAGRTLSFTIAGKTYTASTNSSGVASISFKVFRPDGESLKVDFAGDEFYSSLSKSTKIATYR